MTQTAILTIDDDAGLRELATDVFEHEGYHAIVVPDVASGLTVLGAHTVDLVLLGHHPGPLTDEGFVRAAHQRAGARLPILLWTTLPRPAQRAWAIGADGVIEKPSDLGTLLARVRQGLAAAEPPHVPTAPVRQRAS